MNVEKSKKVTFHKSLKLFTEHLYDSINFCRATNGYTFNFNNRLCYTEPRKVSSFCDLAKIEFCDFTAFYLHFKICLIKNNQAYLCPAMIFSFCGIECHSEEDSFDAKCICI